MPESLVQAAWEALEAFRGDLSPDPVARIGAERRQSQSAVLPATSCQEDLDHIRPRRRPGSTTV
jgi:hypothetical protein